MRQFIVSDLHGNGNVYKSIMSYLENISIDEEVILYINGDLIDKGPDSVEMLMDVKNRVLNGPFKIEYLGGNHELMMYQYYRKHKKPGDLYDLWLNNGGEKTKEQLECSLKEEEIQELVEFVSNLKIYNKFEEQIKSKNIVLVHAACPKTMERSIVQIKEDTEVVRDCVWIKENEYEKFMSNIGNGYYFTIVGHAPNNNEFGYVYNEKGNFLNIDGGNAKYVSGEFNIDHTPLIEVRNEYLRILTFNNHNEILYGNYFINNKSIPFTEMELESERRYLDSSFRPKKLVYYEKEDLVNYEHGNRRVI